jgi:hypothetical protein
VAVNSSICVAAIIIISRGAAVPDPSEKQTASVAVPLISPEKDCSAQTAVKPCDDSLPNE